MQRSAQSNRSSGVFPDLAIEDLTHEPKSWYGMVGMLASSIFVGLLAKVEYHWLHFFAPGIRRTRVGQRNVLKLNMRVR
jgi:hypothetical protein